MRFLRAKLLVLKTGNSSERWWKENAMLIDKIPPTSWYYIMALLAVPSLLQTGAGFYPSTNIKRYFLSKRMLLFFWLMKYSNILHASPHDSRAIPFQHNQGSQGLSVSWWLQGWVSNSRALKIAWIYPLWNWQLAPGKQWLVGGWVSFWDSF